MKRLTALFCIVFAAAILHAEQNDPVLKSYGSAIYPPLARTARVEGQVEVEFRLTSEGDVSSAIVISGNPLLAVGAKPFVSSWKFEPGAGATSERQYRTVITYKLLVPDSPPDLSVAEPTHVQIASYRDVVISSRFNTLNNIYAKDCPKEMPVLPPKEMDNRDYVELSRSGCYGTCPSYTVSVLATGEVRWNGEGFVHEQGTRLARIPSDVARGLVERFRTVEFWSLCRSYSQSVTDNPSYDLSVRLGGFEKSVNDYADSAPAVFSLLAFAVDETSNTHQWRHGDPRAEPFVNIDREYFSKPSLTGLIRASNEADIEKIKQELAGGANIEATDASGWTALMYAATDSSGDRVQMLLNAGADPNHASPQGDTPLMAAAIAYMFDEDLVRGGARVNSQNAKGVTVLMILAANGDADEVKSALKAGADPRLKDRLGRNALDYLKLANCGKNPVERIKMYESDDRKCNALFVDDFKKTEALLRDWRPKK